MFRVNDYVWVASKLTNEIVAQVTEVDGIRFNTTDGFWKTEGRHVTVADAFSQAGHLVPEGAKLVRYTNGQWAYHARGTADIVGNFHGGWQSEEFDIGGCYYPVIFELDLPDFSRMPVSDCLSALPEIVRAALQSTQEAK